jgi:hypothetical protein
MNKSRGPAIAMVFRSASVVMASGVAPSWLAPEVRVVGLIALPTVASLLVLDFSWGARPQRRVLAERDGRRQLEKAA